MAPPIKKKRGEEGEVKRAPDGIIRFEANSISSMNRGGLNGRYSSELEVNGMTWTAKVWRDEDINVGLHCIFHQLLPCSLTLDAEFILIHSDNSKNATAKTSLPFRNDGEWHSVDVLKWEEFIDAEMGFIIDDKITVEARFWITNMRGIETDSLIDFSDAEDPKLDIALVIDGKKVYTGKQTLANNSSVFEAMFYGEFEEKNMDEIELKDVDHEEFLEMLRVIYQRHRKITYESAEYLLKLGDRFQIKSVMNSAEMHLMESNRFSNTEKFRFADKYRLSALLEHCLSKLTTIGDFDDIKNSPIYNDLSDATGRLLFEKRHNIVQ